MNGRRLRLAGRTDDDNYNVGVRRLLAAVSSRHSLLRAPH